MAATLSEVKQFLADRPGGDPGNILQQLRGMLRETESAPKVEEKPEKPEKTGIFKKKASKKK